MRTYVYVDGFNLYYGALKGTPYRWLDLNALFRRIFPPPRNTIDCIRYFTAEVISRPNKPYELLHQQTYIRALETIPNLDVHYGKFLMKTTKGMIVSPNIIDSRTGLPPTDAIIVRLPEEKGSDVNLATYLIADAADSAFEPAIIVSNDTDLVEAVRLVRDRYRRPVGVLSPFKTVSWPLQQACTFYRSIRPGALQASLFPRTLQDANGTITKPPNW